MRTTIVYYSKHHGNTKRLLDAIAATEKVTLIDVTEHPDADLASFDRIGFASGIYFSSFAKQILSFAAEYLPENRDVFYIYTHGAPVGGFLKSIREIAEKKHCLRSQRRSTAMSWEHTTAWVSTPSVHSNS